MEAKQPEQQGNRTYEIYLEIKAGLEQYCQNRSKIEVWNKIFWVLGLYVGKDGPISIEAQKLINFYLQSKIESSHFWSLINQHKELISKVHDMGINVANNMDQALSSGLLAEAVAKKLEKESKEDISFASIFKLVKLCVEAVAIHFCQFLRKFKEAKGAPVFHTNRKIPHILKKKSQIKDSLTFIEEIHREPVTILEGFLDCVKPILTNYLNMESLFEVTSPNFRHKKALISQNTTNISSNTNSSPPKTEFLGKIINLNTIFDATYAGREMIEKKLKELQGQQDNKTKWSILTCISEMEPQLLSILQKLPIFIRPKSNGDILSFGSYDFAPTFRYQVMRAGYCERPILTQTMQVFLNAGKNCVQILAFQNNPNNSTIISSFLSSACQHSNVCQIISNFNIKYSKIRVVPKNIAIVPSNCYYIVMGDSNENGDALTELVHWNVLPKFHVCIKETLAAFDIKRGTLKNYQAMPLQHTLFAYLSHQYLQAKELSILQVLKQYLSSQLTKEQTSLLKLMADNPKITLRQQDKNTPRHLQPHQLFCTVCRRSFINYYGKTSNRECLCMGCCNTCDYGKIVDEVVVVYGPKDLRYPLTLAIIYLTKRRFPGESLTNKYEENVCPGRFIGSICNQNCKADPQSRKAKSVILPNQHKSQQTYLQNHLKQLRIISFSETIISMAVSQPQSEAEKQSLLEKVRTCMKQIEDHEDIIRTICQRYDSRNLVMDVMWELRNASTTTRMFQQ